MNRNSIHRIRPSSRHAGGARLLFVGLAMLVFCVASVRASVANGDDCFTLTIAVSPQEGGEIAITPSPNCRDQHYFEDTEVELTASPNAGFTFVKWSVNDDDTSDEKVLSLKMDANKDVTATFEAIPPTCYILTRSHTGNGGDPTTNPANSVDCPNGQYTAGQSIAVTASPADGWQVAGWGGTTDDSSTETGNTVTMPASGHIVNITYEKTQYLIFLPVVFSKFPAWYRIESDSDPVSNLYTFIACPTGPQRYAGTTDALYEWKSGGWSPMADAPTDVRDFLFVANETDNCQDLYAASFNGGVWRLDGQTWGRVGENNLPFARTLALRDGKLYVGSRSGVFRFDLSAGGDWEQVSNGNVTRLSRSGNRLYAAVFGKGVTYNDSCDAASCEWTSIGEPDFKDAFDVAGDEKGSWVVMATATGVYRWNQAEDKWLPPTTPPQPSGTVFALAEVHDQLFAGVQLGGVWVSNDHGDTWAFINELDALKDKTVIDLIFIPQSGLYAVTPGDGVWRWTIP